ncbi:hypothetical protein BDDG_06233 [Blastomyces dermatitidis ATCC 18188]|uniref:Uncharacterized protein n=1 Tax=Ajellomyces dermatitidis (strain ATCC 18188 / CBS 674.68) TaxID=653446 RepID=F2TJ76_AJEDA|nr:hypothetical protein BDDG_06233 [Blastomyces dermatitidis ATCC 18188]
MKISKTCANHDAIPGSQVYLNCAMTSQAHLSMSQLSNLAIWYFVLGKTGVNAGTYIVIKHLRLAISSFHCATLFFIGNLANKRTLPSRVVDKYYASNTWGLSIQWTRKY